MQRLLIAVAPLVAEHGPQGPWAAGAVECGLRSCGSWVLELRLSSGGTQASLLCDMWDLPGLGIKPLLLALAVGFTTKPPGQPSLFFKIRFLNQKIVHAYDKNANS